MKAHPATHSRSNLGAAPTCAAAALARSSSRRLGAALSSLRAHLHKGGRAARQRGHPGARGGFGRRWRDSRQGGKHSRTASGPLINPTCGMAHCGLMQGRRRSQLRKADRMATCVASTEHTCWHETPPLSLNRGTSLPSPLTAPQSWTGWPAAPRQSVAGRGRRSPACLQRAGWGQGRGRGRGMLAVHKAQPSGQWYCDWLLQAQAAEARFPPCHTQHPSP